MSVNILRHLNFLSLWRRHNKHQKEVNRIENKQRIKQINSTAGNIGTYIVLLRDGGRNRSGDKRITTVLISKLDDHAFRIDPLQLTRRLAASTCNDWKHRPVKLATVIYGCAVRALASSPRNFSVDFFVFLVHSPVCLIVCRLEVTVLVDLAFVNFLVSSLLNAMHC